MSLPCRSRVGRSGRASPAGAFACRVLAWIPLLAVPAWFLRAEPPVITSFHGNGTLAWSNDAGTNAFGVEWAPAATGPWFRDWDDLDAIVSTGTEHSVSIPMFFRVRQAFTPATMRGAWILVHPARGNFHFIAQEDGIVSESAMFIDPLSEIHISGVVSGNSFSGVFECDDDHTTGTVSLVRY